MRQKLPLGRLLLELQEQNMIHQGRQHCEDQWIEILEEGYDI